MPHGIKHESSQALIDYAYRYAKEAHGTQKRKYTGEPYIVHSVAVAQLVASVAEDCEAICAALLHDVIEDTPITYNDILTSFGYGIATLVLEVSDVSLPEHGNRAIRKAVDRRHLSYASELGKTIKLADMINNAESILKHDPAFAKVYMSEMSSLLRVLIDGNLVLFIRAVKQTEAYYAEVGNGENYDSRFASGH